MFRKLSFLFSFFILTGGLLFGQAALLRDYVGLITIQYHPEMVSIMTQVRAGFERRGQTDAARTIDNYLRGISGSGFIYVAPDGRNFIITNQHVVAQSHSISITFERTDGGRTTYERLSVLLVDEEKDLAILSFDDDRRPFTQGLSFNTAGAEEGSEIFAAGFPGIAGTAIWQFSSGRISNAFVRLPRAFDSEDTIGPYIQHTAQIDPGNSGGPLLSPMDGVPTGFAVIGVNTLSARWRQAANYAIPIDQVNDFIGTALNPSIVNERDLISARIEEFMRGLRVNSTLFSHIAGFLSNESTATNAEFAIVELAERAPRMVINEIDRIFASDFVAGMNAAVGWLVEDSMWANASGTQINISLETIEPNSAGGFNVIFNVNGRSVESEWIKEYGVYRMNSYGNVLTGSRVQLADRQRQREQEQALRTEFSYTISAGYAYIFDHGHGITASLSMGVFMPYGISLYRTFSNEAYTQVNVYMGLHIPIRLNTIGIIPFVEGGVGLIVYDSPPPSSNAPFSMDFGLLFKGGIMVTTSAVPGLFGSVFYGHTMTTGMEIDSHGIFGLTIGFGF